MSIFEPGYLMTSINYVILCPQMMADWKAQIYTTLNVKNAVEVTN